MTDNEIKKLLFVTKAAYPQTFARYTEADLENLMLAWKMCLEEYTYDEASRGLKAYLISDNKGFAPAVGQIIDCIQKLNPQAEQMGALEAWSLVYKAICNSNYNSEEEFANLPPLCQKAVGNAYNLKEMASMDLNTVKSVEQSHFIRQYNEYAKRETEINKLPISMRIGLTERAMLEVNK